MWKGGCVGKYPVESERSWNLTGLIFPAIGLTVVHWMALQDDGIELGRRVHERFAVEVEAEVTSEAGSFSALTKDVSRGGACFVVLAPMVVGSDFEISLSLVLSENTFSEPLKLKGRVVWCTRTEEGFQIGAAFGGMDPDTREFLQLFLNFLAKGVDVGQGDEVEEEEEEEEDTEEKGLFG